MPHAAGPAPIPPNPWFLIGWIIYISLFALIIVLLLRMIRNEKIEMRKISLPRIPVSSLGVIILCGLAASLIVNAVVLTEIQGLRLSYDELRRSYEELSLSVVLQPPISKSQAIDIAIGYGGWNETTLKGMEVTATLCYARLFDETVNGRRYGYEVLYRVTEPVSDYGQVRVGNETYGYVWLVIVDESFYYVSDGPFRCIIDAETGEVLYVTGEMTY